MIDCGQFCKKLTGRGVEFFTGVPDSVLRYFVAYLCDHVKPSHHIIAANEGNAVALAAGHYLGKGRPALVYMQNSGQGNAINPLASLAAPEVYGIPMILLVGWRGEPGKKDEPQHLKQGMITRELFDILGIPWTILPDSDEEIDTCLDNMLAESLKRRTPTAIIVKKGSLLKYQWKDNKERTTSCDATLTREDAVQCIIKHLSTSDMVVCTTGKASRELYEYRESRGDGHGQEFLTVGSMGHASQIGLGMALTMERKQLFCIDGDGAVLMHMGGMAIIGSCGVSNFKHIVLNNGAHDSVGGHDSVGFSISFGKIAEACGYKKVMRVRTREDLVEKMALLKACEGPAFLEIVVRKGARKELGRPTTSPFENMKTFMARAAK